MQQTTIKSMRCLNKSLFNALKRSVMRSKIIYSSECRYNQMISSSITSRKFSSVMNGCARNNSELTTFELNGNSTDLITFIEECILHKKNGYEIIMSKDIVEMLEKEAKIGNPRAMFNLGELYIIGLCVEQDSIQAFEWYLKAAERDYNKGKHMVGFCYKNGYGIPTNTKKAFEWFLQAAERGIPLSAYEVACLYIDGRGCEQNLQLALKWGLEAASSVERDIPKAKELVGKLYLFESNYSESLKWLSIASGYGLQESNYWLGWMHLNGRGVPEDYTKAMEFFQKSQNSDSCYRIGSMFEMGWGVSIDKKKAIEWYKKGADLGNKSAQYLVGSHYLENKEYTIAYEYLLKSSQQGEAAAMLNLGQILLEGRPGVEKNLSEGRKWIELAKQAR